MTRARRVWGGAGGGDVDIQRLAQTLGISERQLRNWLTKLNGNPDTQTIRFIRRFMEDLGAW